MATYKLIQDIEAEDKILGPLTLRQFIFGLVGAFFVYLSVFCVTKGAAYLLVLFAPPAIFCGLFAFPFGRDQPTEVWLLAKFRYWFIPRVRIWNQTGVKELVTITVPKKIERVLTDGLSQNEVRSRLQALANTIDSRGWAVKNVNSNTYAAPVFNSAANDRLIDLSTLPQEVPEDNDAIMANDILDPTTNPVAYQMYSLVDRSEQLHRQQVVDRLKAAASPANTQANNWFVGRAASPPAASAAAPPLPAPPVSLPVPMSRDESVLLKDLKNKASMRAEATSNLANLQPHGRQPAGAAMQVNDPAIQQLSRSNDLDIATLARQAQKAKDDEHGVDSGELVVRH